MQVHLCVVLLFNFYVKVMVPFLCKPLPLMHTISRTITQKFVRVHYM